MKIGEIVETMIRVRDSLKGRLNRDQDDAICAACNILDTLPTQAEERDARIAMHGLMDETPNRYRTRKELIDYFRQLAFEFQRDGHRDNENPVLLAKAECYELAAFQVEHNTREGAAWQ